MAEVIPDLDLSAKLIFFTDFDGTITTEDSLDSMVIDLGYGKESLERSTLDVLEGRMILRDAFKEQIGSVKSTLKDCLEWQTRNVSLDENFDDFAAWAEDNKVPVVVLSGGLRPVIHALLRKSAGSAGGRIPVLSNDVIENTSISQNGAGRLAVIFNDDSTFGMDKSRYIDMYSQKVQHKAPMERPVVLYAGDGISDMCAARSADLLFAKRGADLVTYCRRENIPFTEFTGWSEILAITQQIFMSKDPHQATNQFAVQSQSHDDHSKTQCQDTLGG